ncbi:hypothetical protein [uncultured Hyphomonas sp.]|uniref:hypothetical protein n=1 Tax=uncultured Hyphomonas sp. TaxID=225298 RepID=UPI002AABB515|nr:hypothetical protein [uncultured Hyphomonas sp.]
MPVTDWLTTAEAWANAHMRETQYLAALGLVLGGLFAAFLLILTVRLIVRLVRRLGDVAAARALRSDKTPGYRIVLARPAGGRRGTTLKWLQSALSDHLTAFNFGAPFKLGRMSVLKGGLAPETIARARRRMAAADADLLVWGERRRRKAEGLVLHGLTRGGGLSPANARVFTLRLPAHKDALEGQMPKIAAFLLAKKLQPGLGNPQSFRPEKISLLAEALSGMLDHDGPMPVALRNEIEGDFCASAVHVAEEAGDLAGLDRVIALSREHLTEGAVQENPERAIQARMNIGRALLARAAKKYEAELVREAIGYLSQVVEALRTDPSIMRAQAASDAMFKAQSLMETRKRFAVNFGT